MQCLFLSLIHIFPHITNEIKRRMLEVSLKEDAPDVVITEIGGTVGDIESLPFLEAARQLKSEVEMCIRDRCRAWRAPATGRPAQA